MTAEEQRHLAASGLFAGLAPGRLIALLGRVRYGVRQYKAGRLVTARGEDCRHLRILVGGLLRSEMTDAEGRAVEVEMLVPSRCLAPGFLFGRENRMPVDVWAASDSRLFVLDRSALIILFRLDEVILRNFLDLVSTRTQFLARRLRSLSFGTIRKKLLDYLGELPRDGDGWVCLDRSLEELSGFFGVARPSLSRVLGDLEREGRVFRNGRRRFRLPPPGRRGQGNTRTPSR